MRKKIRTPIILKGARSGSKKIRTPIILKGARSGTGQDPDTHHPKGPEQDPDTHHPKNVSKICGDPNNHLLIGTSRAMFIDHGKYRMKLAVSKYWLSQKLNTAQLGSNDDRSGKLQQQKHDCQTLDHCRLPLYPMLPDHLGVFFQRRSGHPSS